MGKGELFFKRESKIRYSGTEQLYRTQKNGKRQMVHNKFVGRKFMTAKIFVGRKFMTAKNGKFAKIGAVFTPNIATFEQKIW